MKQQSQREPKEKGKRSEPKTLVFKRGSVVCFSANETIKSHPSLAVKLMNQFSCFSSACILSNKNVH